jgi:hypothetical protein
MPNEQNQTIEIDDQGNLFHQNLLDQNKAQKELDVKLTEQSKLFYKEWKEIKEMEYSEEKAKRWTAFLERYPTAPVPPSTLIE